MRKCCRWQDSDRQLAAAIVGGQGESRQRLHLLLKGRQRNRVYVNAAGRVVVEKQK